MEKLTNMEKPLIKAEKFAQEIEKEVERLNRFKEKISQMSDDEIPEEFMELPVKLSEEINEWEKKIEEMDNSLGRMMDNKEND